MGEQRLKTAREVAIQRLRGDRMLGIDNQAIVVPGYGMAVTQGQHAVRELYEALLSAAWM